MSPILGIYASQISGHLVPPNSYASIATQTVGSGGASSITFSSIPSTYTHLQVRAMAQSSVSDSTLRFTFNGDSGSNYTTHSLNANGSSVSAFGVTGFPGFDATYNLGSGFSTSYFGVLVMDILDYTNTNKYTTARNLYGFDYNGSGKMGLTSSLWLNTAAITSVTVTPTSGSLIQYSSFALYGVK
jgi:hypothetical protein